MKDFQCLLGFKHLLLLNPCYDSNSYGFDQPPQYSFDHQPQSIQEDLNQQRMNDVLKAVHSLVEKLCQQEQASNLSTHTLEPSVEDLVPIPSESEDTSNSDSECDLHFCDNPVTFSNPLFNDIDDFTSSDDESLPEEDVPKENLKIYSNHLFEFDDEYISSDVNPLFNKVLEEIESDDSYVSKLDEPNLLVTPLFKLNEDECFDPGGDFILEEIKACPISDSIPPRIDDADFDPEGDILLLEKLLNDDPSFPLPPKELNFEELKVIKSDVSMNFEDDYYDLEEDIIYLESLLIKDTILNLPPEVFLDRDPRSLEDEPDKDDLKNIVKVFDPGIYEKFFSPTYVKLPFEDRHYLSLTYVIRIFLPYFTYPVDSSLPLSSRSEDTIFDLGISVFHFSSLEPVASHRSGTFICFNVYLKILNESPMEIFKLETRTKNKSFSGGNPCFLLFLFSNKCDEGGSPLSFLVFRGLCFMFRIAPDFEDSRARGFVHRSLDLQSLACLYMGNRYPRSY
ncbi:hypothetical protein Tco_1310230 [Tanacetum coccineum]